MNTEKERLAILYLREFEPKDDDKGYYLCYSGGKDSDAIRILAQLAGVKHECKHSLTTVDAPESVRYVQRTIGRENIEIPPPLDVGPYRKKGYAAHASCTLLLRGTQRARRNGALENNRCACC